MELKKSTGGVVHGEVFVLLRILVRLSSEVSFGDSGRDYWIWPNSPNKRLYKGLFRGLFRGLYKPLY